MPGQPGNENATTHGGYSARRTGPVAAGLRRRMLRQHGLRLADLDGAGVAALAGWARAAAALAVLDEYAAEHGWLDGDGEPRPFTRLYLGLLNAERLGLGRLEEHVRRSRRRDPRAALDAYLDGEDGRA